VAESSRRLGLCEKFAHDIAFYARDAKKQGCAQYFYIRTRENE
jgi:hypothetical protein